MRTYAYRRVFFLVDYFLCIGTAKYTKASPPARKMSLFSSIIITIILCYVIIRIYIILLTCLQVSKTEGLAELLWVIGQSVLEKVKFNKLPRFQKFLLRIRKFLIPRLHKLKAVYLNFDWFNDARTRGFELLTRGFEIITRGFELALLNFNSYF